MIGDKMSSLDDIEGASNRNPPNTEQVKTVMSEIGERKSRENNIVIYGIQEKDSPVSQVRMEHDKEAVSEILGICDIKPEEMQDAKPIRLGKVNKEKPHRPILIQLENQEMKGRLFKNAHKLRRPDNNKENVRIANDLTKVEREIERKLYMEAKDLQSKEKGNFLYKVRGPPWARRVAKLPKDQ